MSVLADLTAVQQRIAQIAPSADVPAAATAAFGTLVRSLPAAGDASIALKPQIEALAQRSAREVSVDPALIEAVVASESAFDAHATSAAGARGLMQLMPGTAAALGVTDPYDPAQNVRGGARYLRTLLDRFGGDIRLALAAYNAGPGSVEQFRGIPPYAETRAYVDRVLATYQTLARR